MQKLFLGMTLCGVLAGCGYVKSSKLNPGNWGTADAQKPQDALEIRPLTPAHVDNTSTDDPRALVDRLIAVEVSNVTGGVLLRAVGQVNAGRAYGAALTPEGVHNGALTFAFRTKTTSGTSQPITVAVFIPEKDMRGLRSIQVQGENRSISKGY